MLRPMMYVEDLEQKQIVAFIHGLEIGDSSLKLTNKLSFELDNNYKIKITGDGWPYQIERFSKKENMSWFDALKFLTLKLLDAD